MNSKDLAMATAIQQPSRRRWEMTNSEGVEILLVEDSDSDAELTIHALRKSKIANKIQRVCDGAEALDYLFCRANYQARSFDTPPSLVLLDLKLPKVDGLQVLQAIKGDARTKAIPVIVLTSSHEERDLVNSYQTGANSYIQKPVDFSAFQEVVRHLGMYWLLMNSKPPAAAFLTS
jgi:two-component system response regulator